jgi:hypothetical protein
MAGGIAVAELGNVRDHSIASQNQVTEVLVVVQGEMPVAASSQIHCSVVEQATSTERRDEDRATKACWGSQSRATASC